MSSLGKKGGNSLDLNPRGGGRGGAAMHEKIRHWSRSEDEKVTESQGIIH
jgi:hypothetical protein